MPKQKTMSLQPPPKSIDRIWTPDDIYAAVDNDINIVTRFKEDRRVERKSAKITDRTLGDYYTVYANKQPHGGVIFIGVEDDGTLTGCSCLSEKKLNNLERAHAIHCPDARIESKHIPIYNDKREVDFIIAIRVNYHKAKLVETVRGDAFTRDGSSKRKLTDLEKREVRIAKREIDFEREDVPLKWPKDFNQKLVSEYCKNLSKNKGLKSKQSNVDILVNNRLGRKEGKKFHPNSACALLFANDPLLIFPGAYIRLMKFAGYEERTGSQYNLIDGKDFWIEGPLPILITEAERLIELEMRSFTRLVDGKFLTKPEYPKEVWLEAVVNACVHRSYNYRNMAISVKMFDDKIVIESPGGFPPPTTAETIAEVGHNPRNPFLMGALYHFNVVKCAHEGVRRMNEVMNQEKLPVPEFMQAIKDSNNVRVILRNDFEQRKSFIDTDAEISIDESTYKLLGNNEKKIVNYLSEHHSINVTDASNLLGVSWKTAKGIIVKLINMKLCQYEKSEISSSKNPKKRIILVKQ